MSIEQDKNKAVLDDEKFIDDLYAQLKEEKVNDDALNERPSSALDNKILAAAHQSVNSESKVLTIESAVEKKAKKPRAWYISVGIAASTVLAVSLVVNQSDEVLVSSQPNMEIMSLTDEAIVNQPSIAEAEEAVLLTQAKREKAVTAKKEQMSSLRARHAEKSVRAANLIQQKKTSSTFADFSMADTAEKPVQQLAQENDREKVGDTLWLTSAQYQRFLQQKYLWSPIQENDSVYVISIYKNAEQAKQYQLSKATFNISDFANGNNKRYPFQQIKLK